MGATRNTGYLENLIQYDASDNVAIATSVNPSYKVTLGGSMLGTSAVFSSSVTAGGNIKTTGGHLEYASGYAIYPRTVSVTDWYLLKHNAALDRIENGIGTNKDFTIGNDIGGVYYPNIKLNGSGSATFSSSVQATAVAIGVTPTANILVVKGENNNFDGTIRIGERGYLQHRDAGNTITSLANDYNNDAAKIEFRVKGNTTSDAKMTILGSGNVGIGVTTVPATLTIQNSGENSIEWHRSADMKGMIGIPSASGQIITGSATNEFCIRTQSNMLFATGGATERMRITSGGNVGIGRTSPLGALDVKGSAFIGNLSNNPNFGIASIGKTISNGATADCFEIEVNDNYGGCMFSIDLAGGDVNGIARYFTGKRFVEINGGSSIGVYTVGTDATSGSISMTATHISGNRFKVTITNSTGQTLYCGISIQATGGGSDGENTGWLVNLTTL